MVAKYGKEYTWDLRMRVLGCTEQMSVHKIVSELKLPISEERYRAEVKELLRKMLPEATLMPGIVAVAHADPMLRYYIYSFLEHYFRLLEQVLKN